MVLSRHGELNYFGLPDRGTLEPIFEAPREIEQSSSSGRVRDFLLSRRVPE